jgi:hypothetical protein
VAEFHSARESTKQDSATNHMTRRDLLVVGLMAKGLIVRYATPVEPVVFAAKTHETTDPPVLSVHGFPLSPL